VGTSHEFLALDDDWASVVAWLTDHGAVAAGRHPQQGTLIFHFPQLGPLSVWPEHSLAKNYPESSIEWKAAILATAARERDPEVPHINQLTSPVAGAVPPVHDEGGFWRSAKVWFPTPRLRETFPDLARINGQLERWVRKNPLVFDNTACEHHNPYGEQLGGFAGIIRKVHALPTAAARLSSGGTFVAYGTSDKVLSEFLRHRELAGNPVA
jgi:hypothetical protein